MANKLNTILRTHEIKVDVKLEDRNIEQELRKILSDVEKLEQTKVRMDIELADNIKNLPSEIAEIEKSIERAGRKISVDVKLKGLVGDLSKQIGDLNKQYDSSASPRSFKIKAELDELGVGDINKYLSKIGEKFEGAKSAEPLKLKLDVDVEGSAKQITDQMDKILKIAKDFKSQYGQVMDEMEKETGQSIRGMISSKDVAVVESQLADMKRSLQGAFDGQDGVFSSQTFRDAEGNINKLVGTYRTASGEIRTITKQLDDNGKFVPVSQRDVDETERNASQMSKSLRRVAREIDTIYDSSPDKSGLVRDLDRLNRELMETGRVSAESVRGLEHFTRETKQNQVALEQSGRSLNNVHKHMRELNNMNLSDNLSNEVRDLTRELDRLEKEFDEVADPHKFNAGMKGVESELRRIKDTVKNSNKEIADSYRDMSSDVDRLTEKMGTDVRKNLVNAIKSGDLDEIRRWTGLLKEGELQTLRVASTTDRFGNAIHKLSGDLSSSGQSVRKINIAVDDLGDNAKASEVRIRDMGDALDYNLTRNMGLIERMKTAVAGIGAFELIREGMQLAREATRHLVDELFELDGLMVEIKRVASDDLNIGNMFSGAVAQSRELGASLEDILGSLGDVTRTWGHFNENQLLAVNKTATIMSNVSELDLGASIDSLIGTMNAFDIKAEESIQIVDKFNEVDNNFAISTQQIAQSMSRAGATAKTFGVDIDNLIGHVTAIGSVTMQSGEQIGTALRTIYSRITTNDGAVAAIEEIGVSISKLNEETGEYANKDVSDILGEIAGKWDNLSSAQQQNLGIAIAGTNRLTQFLALMENWSMASEVTTTSLNSQGSAMKEQLAYMDSYEARVNRMKTSITQLAVSIGDSFLEDALYVGIDLIDKMSLSLADLIDQFGALPLIFGAGGILTSAMTKSGGPLEFLKMIGSQVGGVFTKMQEGALSVGTRISSSLSRIVGEFAQSGNAIKQVIGGVGQGIQKVMGSLGVAGSGLLATAGITAAFVAVGYAIDKLLERQRALNEAQRKYEDTMERSREAVRNHGNDLTGLVGRYEELEKVINSGNYSDEELAEYNKTINDLSEAIPGAVSHIDSLGEVHLKNTDVIYDEARAVEDLAREYANIDAGELGEGITEQIENIKILSEQTNTLKDRVEGLKMTISEGGYWESYGEGSEKVKETTEKIDEQTNAVRVLEAQMSVAMKEITDGIQSQVLLLVEANDETYNLTGAAESMSNAFVDAQKQMMNINMDDFYDKWGRFDSDGFAKAITDAQNEITAKAVDFTENLNEMYGRIGEGFKGEKLSEIRNAMDSVLDKARESGVAIDEGLIVSLENLNNSIANGGSTVDDFVQHLVNLGFESDDAKSLVIDMGDAHGNAAIKFKETQGALASLSDELADYREELEAINTIDVVYGVDSETTKAIESHLSTLELLKAEYSEGWYDTTAGQESVKQMADELNVSEEYIKQHLGTVTELFQALSSVEVEIGEDGSPVKKYADTISKDTIDMLDEIQHLVQHSGITFEEALVSVLDTTIVVSEEKLKQVQEVFNNASIDTPEGESNLVKGLAKELDELEGSFSAVADEAGNLQFVMSDGTENELLAGISGALHELGFDLSITTDDFTGLRQVMVELPSGGELPIATIPDTVYEGTESIGQLKQAFIDFQDLTNVEQKSAFIESINGQMDMFRDDLRVVNDEVDGFQLVLSDGTTSPWLDVLNQQLELVGAKIIDANAETEEFELGIQWEDGSQTIFDGAGSSAIDYLSDVERANAHTETMEESLQRVKQLTDEVLAEHNAAMIEIDENNDIKYTAELDQESLNAVIQGLDVDEQLSELHVLDEEGNIQVVFATHATGTEVTAQQISEVTGQAQQLATYTDEFGNIVQYFIPEVKNEDEARKVLASLLSDDNIGEVVSDGSGGWKVTYKASVNEESLNETEGKLNKVGKNEDGSDRSVVYQAESTGTDTVIAEFDNILLGAEKVEGMSINVNVTEGTITSLGELRSLLGLVDEDIKTTVDLAMDMILKLEAAGDAAQTIMKQAPSLRGITAEAESLMVQLEETAGALQNIFDLAQQDLSIDISATFSGFEDLVAQMENVKATLHELSKVTTAQANRQVNTYKNMSSEVKKILADMGVRISKEFSDIARDSKNKTEKMGKDVIKSLNETRSKAINAMKSMGQGMLNEITKKYREIVKESSSLPGRIGKGIRDNMSQASSSMQSLADNMVSRFEKALGIKSPSRVFMKLGGHVIDGLVKGLSDGNIKDLGQDVFSNFSQGAFSTIDDIKAYMTFDPVSPANFGGSFTRTSNFGPRRSPGGIGSTNHQGVDYAAPTGTPIRAQSGGRVVISGYHSGYGNYVAVQNGPVRQIYAHNSRNMAQVGQTVKAGQIIGLVGSTGNSTGPHVHYEVRVNGRAVNPSSYFRGFADGGFVDKEELAWHGEDGPEAIIPLSAERRERGLDLWAEAGERMGLSRELIDLYKRSGTAAQASVSAFSAMDGEMAASSDGEAGAGTFVPSTNDIMRVVNPEYSAMEKEELPELYRYMSYGSMMELQDIKELEKARAVLGTLTEGAIEYRNAMKEVWSQTKDVIKNERKELEKLNDRQRELSFRIVQLKREGAETNKASKKMREEYNAAQQEYEENYSRIYELENNRVQNIASNNQTIIDMHKDMVNELIDIYNRLEQVRSDAIADYQYQLDHLSITQPEKIGRQMTLNYQILSETNALMQVQANRVSQLTKEMDKFNKAYGPDDERTRHTQEALRQATSEYRSTVLTVANLEKSLEDTRREVAENSVEDVKKYHSQVHSMTVRALELERQEYEKSHEKRMKMYDDEISRIESIYDAKIKALDADKEETAYQEELESLSNERAEVMSSISRLSRDNSLEAKKQMKELQDELLRIDGDIKSTQEARQDKLYRDAIEEQKQSQIDEFERGRELDEKAHESRMDALEEQKNASDRYYEDMLGDERKWDNIVDAYVRGDDNKLSAAIGEMNRGLNKLSAGDFFNLTVGYDGLSRNSKAQITEETLMDIKNLVYNSSKNTERMADIYNNRGDHYIRHIPIDTVTPPKSDSWSGQTTKSDAVADKAGIYAEVQRREKNLQKVAPKVSDSSSSSSTVKQRSHKISRGDTLWDLAQKYYGDPYKWKTIASANSSINPSSLPVGKNLIIPFRDGGMTPDWPGNEGKIAMLHKKELVLTAEQTEDILGAARYMGEVVTKYPTFDSGKVSVPELSASNNTNTTVGDINLYFDNYKGTKEESKNVAQEIIKNLKKF